MRLKGCFLPGGLFLSVKLIEKDQDLLQVPLRNRILSGLCLGVLAVECEPQGGTMLTVNHALEQGREVYAIPIGLDERRARGTNRLIHEGKARLVESARDILEDYADLFPAKLAGMAPLPQAVVEIGRASCRERV